MLFRSRAFEVYAMLLKILLDGNKDNLNIYKQLKDINPKGDGTNTHIDKAIFVGSTAELGKLLKDNGNKK